LKAKFTEFKVEETFDGIVPVSLLFDRSTLASFGNANKFVGIDPVRKFCCRASVVREAKGDKSGIDPLSLFIDKEIMDKLVYRIALGMVPVISQFIQEKVRNCVNKPIESGILDWIGIPLKLIRVIFPPAQLRSTTHSVSFWLASLSAKAGEVLAQSSKNCH
jgi:hypothetical protein